jgi:hypothetical protein
MSIKCRIEDATRPAQRHDCDVGLSRLMLESPLGTQETVDAKITCDDDTGEAQSWESVYSQKVIGSHTAPRSTFPLRWLGRPRAGGLACRQGAP